jgi:hypothetical protein
MTGDILYKTLRHFPSKESQGLFEPPGREEAPLPAAPPGESAEPQKPFPLEMWDAIKFEIDEEYLIDGVVPAQGVGLLYGASQTFKSFIAIDLALCVERGEPWAGRATERKPIAYIAAEGAGGIRKRREGYVRTGRAPAKGVQFALIAAAPNLGTATGDCERLGATIIAAGIKPGLIVIDTVAKAIGGADENGSGMGQFLLNAERLAAQFACFVLCVHHTGHDQDKKDRPRGWSGLPAALDMQMLAERNPGEMCATVTLQKLKDEPSGVRLEARLERVALGVSKTGREVSTLIVADISETDAPAAIARNAPAVPRAKRLLREMLTQALDEAGESLRPFANGPIVRAVHDERVRDRYYAAIAEQAAPDESEERLAERQRKAFNRAVKSALDAKEALARQIAGRRMIWLP